MSIEQRSPRVGILSASLGRVPGADDRSTREILDEVVGRNTGNLAFRYAVDLHVASEKVHVTWGADPDWVREVCDLLVIPSSNQVNPGADFSQRADFLERVDLPCLAVGLGAQAPSIRAEIKLGSGTLRYIRMLAERCRSIGVRGTYTAETLARLGIRNTVVVGCPSHFINPAPALGSIVERKLRRWESGRLVMTDIELAPGLQTVGCKLFDWMLKHNGFYVCQSHYSFISLARGRRDEVVPGELDQLRSYLLSDDSQFRAHGTSLLARGGDPFRVFFDVDTWLRFLAATDLSIGVRFHGSQLAVQAATPGVCIVHDARTHELCETAALPHVSVEQFMAARTIKDVCVNAIFDGNCYDTRRGGLARAYRELLEDSGIVVGGAPRTLTEPSSPSAVAGFGDEGQAEVRGDRSWASS